MLLLATEGEPGMEADVEGADTRVALDSPLLNGLFPFSCCPTACCELEMGGSLGPPGDSNKNLLFSPSIAFSIRLTRLLYARFPCLRSSGNSSKYR